MTRKVFPRATNRDWWLYAKTGQALYRSLAAPPPTEGDTVWGLRERVMCGEFALALFAERQGIDWTPTYENAVAATIRSRPAWHKVFLNGTLPQVERIVLKACRHIEHEFRHWQQQERARA